MPQEANLIIELVLEPLTGRQAGWLQVFEPQKFFHRPMLAEMPGAGRRVALCKAQQKERAARSLRGLDERMMILVLEELGKDRVRNVR